MTKTETSIVALTSTSDIVVPAPAPAVVEDIADQALPYHPKIDDRHPTFKSITSFSACTPAWVCSARSRAGTRQARDQRCHIKARIKKCVLPQPIELGGPYCLRWYLHEIEAAIAKLRRSDETDDIQRPSGHGRKLSHGAAEATLTD